MKRLSTFSRQTNVTDAQDVRDLGQSRWFRSPGILIGISLVMSIIAAASWWTYAVYLRPSRDQRLVDEVTTILQTKQEMIDWNKKTVDWSYERKLIVLSKLFLSKSLGVPSELGIEASRAALSLAIHIGSTEARLALGKSQRDGDFGDKNPNAALAQFQTAYEELQPGIQTGDQDALYVYSLMLKEGLGVESNPAKAREILKRVALSRDYLTMRSIGFSALYGNEEDRDLEMVKAISRNLIDSGHPESYTLGSLACSKEYEQAPGEDEQMYEMVKAGDHSGLAPLLTKNVLRMKQSNRCRLPFLEAAAEKGDKNAIEELASSSSDASSPTLRSQLPTPTVPTADPEAQSRTGYLNGTKQIAKGGLSTFKVDNTKGGGDAVVRLYRDGRKPAARSMFVKNGESFTAEAVASGAYRLRYRYIGSTDTFEADETFTLFEIPTDNGTRFSRVTVTLYKVANGNMSVRKVDAAEF